MSDIIDMYEDEYLLAQIEFKEGLVFFHTDVKKEVDKSCVRNAREVFKGIKQKVWEMGYERLYALTPSPHFARLFGKGFITIPEEGLKAMGMELLVWELEEEL